MGFSNFCFQSSYTGYWNLDDNTKAPGTLYVHDHSIELEVYFESDGFYRMKEKESIKGDAYTNDEQKSFKHYNFLLIAPHLVDGNFSSEGLNRCKFDVESLYIYQEGYDLREIKSVCIRTCLLDKWMMGMPEKGFKVLESNVDTGFFRLENNPHAPISLYRDDANFEVYIYFGWNYHFSANGYSLDMPKYLNIDFGNKHLNINEAYEEVNKIKYLFSLLWNCTFCPDFLEFRTTEGDCILKTSDKYAYEYVEGTAKKIPQSSFNDFDETEFNAQFAKWYGLYTEQSVALDTFFETLFNEHTPPFVRIKNYVSTIDSLTKSYNEPCKKTPQRKEVKDAVNEILSKLDNILTGDEKQSIRIAVYKEERKSLKPRFKKLIEDLEDVLPVEIDDTFVNKVVNTRNNITHPQNQRGDAFTFEEYKHAAYLLSIVIKSNLLKAIKVDDVLARKIINVRPPHKIV